ncbi:putative Scj1p [Gigaspora margarita]|uniref:Putative Scj1p n=1 Tax=Gigaspora margarita TaxID=4874 RepID=A0A8H4A6P0_GIGMA|nr:putative Scj1p [Gigaspora margarita]
MQNGFGTESNEDMCLSADEIKVKANELYKVKNYETAIRLYSRAIDMDPTSPTFYTNRAAALMMLKKPKDALKDCHKALVLDPTSTKALLRGAKCNFALGNLTEAERWYTKILNAEPNNQQAITEYRQLQQVQDFINQAGLCLQNRQYLQAAHLIDRASSYLDEIPAKWKIMKGETLLEQKEYAEASRIANEILRGDQQNPDAHVLRARILYVEGDNQKAAAHCQEALRCDPDHTKARILLRKARTIETQKNAGNEAFKREDFITAYNIYTATLEVDPENKNTNSKLYSNRSAVLVKQGKLVEAIKDMDKALELDPTFVKVLKRRADAYMKLEKYAEAVQDLKAALEIDSTNQETRRELRNAELELKKASRKDYYKILGIPKDASENEIKKAYRKAALQHHPDKNCGDSEAEVKFKEIGEAYAILSDPVKKQRYDSGADIDGPNCGMDFDTVDPNLFFQMFMNSEGFGNNGPRGGGFSGFNGFSSRDFPRQRSGGYHSYGFHY